jgi:class 3 adenylate cyclase
MTDSIVTWQVPSAAASEHPPALRHRLAHGLAGSLSASVILLLIVLAGLPIAVWLDLRHLSENALRSQADGLATVIGNVRSYYAANVVGRVLAHSGETQVLGNYQDVAGAIPIPATLSLELGSVLGDANNTTNMRYRFVSDYPFAKRAPHAFDEFERQALAALREKRQTSLYNVSGSIFDRQVRLITPIVMGVGCVNCHNTHPESPKRDWKVGDVRGIEEFSVNQPIAANVFAFKYLLIYFVLVTVIGVTFIGLQRHQASVIAQVNRHLGKTNEFLAGIAQKLAKYLSPQLYRSIFSGQKDVLVSTERKKLTIFFSDVVSFTATAERLQPEELTALLNEYLTEMSQVASKHGGTVDKFIGDAILVFFGDPETGGVEQDARACLRMAFDMQRRLAELNVQWRRRGIEEPFRARMGINTGYCNVGNFGSNDRMDYTIIGGEANLAARLQSIAEPGGIILSYETFVLVSDMVRARALAPIALKGISRQVIPYAVEGPKGTGEQQIIIEHAPGLDLFLDVKALDPEAAERVARVLESALLAVKQGQDTEA